MEIHGKGLNQLKMKNKIINWIKKPSNILAILIFILAIGIRIYYFSLTKNQPLWWDEADYMAYAKNLAGLPIDWIVSNQHSSIFPLISSIFFMASIPASAIKFSLVIIPSILVVILSYMICRLMYADKRIALITSFLTATLWAVLFNTFRFHIGIPALLFGLLAIYVFWQGYERKEKIFGKINPKWTIPLTVILVLACYSIRRAYFVFGGFFLIYMLFSTKFSKLVKDKFNWMSLALAITLLFIIEGFVFITPITQVYQTYDNPGTPFNLIPFDIFKSYFFNIENSLLSPLFVLFWLGVAIIVIRLLFSIGHFRKLSRKAIRADFFAIATIAVTLSYFLFYQQAQGDFGEPRWYFPLLFGSLICISRSSTWIADKIKKHGKIGKIIAIIFLFLIIGYGGYYEVKQADNIIQSRISSFSGVKDASSTIKTISNEQDVVLAYPTPIVAYYSERSVLDPEVLFGKKFTTVSQEEFMEKMREVEVKYLVIHFFEPSLPDWMRKINYATNPQTQQNGMVSWEVQFMDTKIDFISQEQDIKESKDFGNLRFTLRTAQQDTFVYEITRFS
jgi:uncharacterized membrane protein